MPGIETAKVNLKLAASRINLAHAEFMRLGQKAVLQAIQAGDALNTVKSSVDHGQFGDWIDQNVKCSRRECQRYMSIADRKQHFENATRVSHLPYLAHHVAEHIKSIREPENGPRPDRVTVPASDADEPTWSNGRNGRVRAAANGARSKPVKVEKPEPVAKPEPEPDPTDGAGNVIPDSLREAFANVEKIDAALNLLRQLRGQLNALAGAGMDELSAQRQKITNDLDNARSAISFSRPFAVCPYRHNQHICGACKGRGWLVKDQWKQLPENMRKGKE